MVNQLSRPGRAELTRLNRTTATRHRALVDRLLGERVMREEAHDVRRPKGSRPRAAAGGDHIGGLFGCAVQRFSR